MNTTPVLTIGPNGGVQLYTSGRAASRALSGTGSDNLRTTISRRLAAGGGLVGNVFVISGAAYSISRASA